MCEKIITVCTHAFLQFDEMSASSHCHSALRNLATDDAHYDALPHRFMTLRIGPPHLYTPPLASGIPMEAVAGWKKCA